MLALVEPFLEFDWLRPVLPPVLALRLVDARLGWEADFERSGGEGEEAGRLEGGRVPIDEEGVPTRPSPPTPVDPRANPTFEPIANPAFEPTLKPTCPAFTSKAFTSKAPFALLILALISIPPFVLLPPI